jgi:hypothetical protein
MLHCFFGLFSMRKCAREPKLDSALHGYWRCGQGSSAYWVPEALIMPTRANRFGYTFVQSSE